MQPAAPAASSRTSTRAQMPCWRSHWVPRLLTWSLACASLTPPLPFKVFWRRPRNKLAISAWRYFANPPPCRRLHPPGQTHSSMSRLLSVLDRNPSGIPTTYKFVSSTPHQQAWPVVLSVVGRNPSTLLHTFVTLHLRSNSITVGANDRRVRLDPLSQAPANVGAQTTLDFHRPSALPTPEA